MATLSNFKLFADEVGVRADDGLTASGDHKKHLRGRIGDYSPVFVP